MTRIKLPLWMRDEAGKLIERQMAIARMLTARMTDPDCKGAPSLKGLVKGRDVTAVVQKLDEAAQMLNALVGGTDAFDHNTQDYKTAIAFSAYCDRAMMQQKRNDAPQ